MDAASLSFELTPAPQASTSGSTSSDGNWSIRLAFRVSHAALSESDAPTWNVSRTLLTVLKYCRDACALACFGSAGGAAAGVTRPAAGRTSASGCDVET